MEKKSLMLVLSSILIPFLIILLSYFITLGFIPTTPAQQATIEYLLGQERLYFNYTQQEQAHLQDVKLVMTQVKYFFYVLVATMLWILIYSKKDRTFLVKIVQSGGKWTMLSMGIVFLLLLVSFSTAFTLFHEIFFPQGNWIFPADSLLIQTFPQEFFIRIGYILFGLALLGGILLVLFGRYLAAKR